jgi:virulence-associated protein VapD
MDIDIMYAIAFDLDTEALKINYHPVNYPNAYKEVRDFLATKGFSNKQGSLYYGDDTVTQVSTILTIVELSRVFPWLKNSVSDIRVLQLLNADDLRPALETGNPL